MCGPSVFKILRSIAIVMRVNVKSESPLESHPPHLENEWITRLSQHNSAIIANAKSNFIPRRSFPCTLKWTNSLWVAKVAFSKPLLKRGSIYKSEPRWQTTDVLAFCIRQQFEGIPKNTVCLEQRTGLGMGNVRWDRSIYEDVVRYCLPRWLDSCDKENCFISTQLSIPRSYQGILN